MMEQSWVNFNNSALPVLQWTIEVRGGRGSCRAEPFPERSSLKFHKMNL